MPNFSNSTFFIIIISITSTVTSIVTVSDIRADGSTITSTRYDHWYCEMMLYLDIILYLWGGMGGVYFMRFSSEDFKV